MSNGTKGKVVGVNGNMVSVDFEGNVQMNEVAYVVLGDKRLKSEVIRISGSRAELQVFERTRGIGIDDAVEFTSEMLAVRLGPGLLGQIFDGLQNPLPLLAEKHGFFSSAESTFRRWMRAASGPSRPSRRSATR